MSNGGEINLGHKGVSCYTHKQIFTETLTTQQDMWEMLYKEVVFKGGRPLGVNKHEILPLYLFKWQDEHTKGSFRLPSITSSSIVRWDLTCCVPKRGTIFALTSFHLLQTRWKARQALQGSAIISLYIYSARPDPVGVVRIRVELYLCSV